MFFHRLGFFRGPWELHRLPGGDSYRITLAPIGGTFPAEDYPFDGQKMMRSITWWVLKDNVFPLETRVVQGLLEIHRAVRPQAREVDVETFAQGWGHRERGHMEYLARVAEELTDAVRIGLLRVELLPPLQIAMQREKRPSEKPPDRPANESTAWVAFRLVDQDEEQVARRQVTLTCSDKEERAGVLSSTGRERFERIAPGDCKLVFPEFDVSDFAEPRALPGKKGDSTGPVENDAGGTVYVVKAGDTQWTIAAANYFENFETIWNADENKVLRDQRENPQSLMQGDQVAIPAKKRKTLSIPTGKESSFQVFIAKRLLRIRLHDAEAKPISDTVPYRIVAGGAIIKQGDSSGGWVEAKIPINGYPTVLRLDWGQPDAEGESPFSANIRTDFEQSSERERTMAQLNNLGYRATEDAYEQAVHSFQADYGVDEAGLDEAGNLLPRTKDVLESIFGGDCDASKPTSSESKTKDDTSSEMAFDSDGASSCLA